MTVRHSPVVAPATLTAVLNEAHLEASLVQPRSQQSIQRLQLPKWNGEEAVTGTAPLPPRMHLLGLF